jgi:mxaA protein
MFKTSILVMLTIVTMHQEVHAAADAPRTEEQPRQFGYFLGDILTQRISLSQDASDDPSRLPPADRVGTWFERRTPRLERTEDGSRWLVIEYQIVNAPAVMTVVTLPALKLTLKDGKTLDTKDWPISLGPLAAAKDGEDDLTLALRPDHRIAALPDQSIRQRLTICATALAVSLAAWLFWILWRNRRDAVRLPFALAYATIKRSEASGRGEDEWIVLHRAINTTAGRVIQFGSLGRLFDDHPTLRPMRSELESFYRESAVRFFSPAPTTKSSLSILELCERLRRIERQSDVRR